MSKKNKKSKSPVLAVVHLKSESGDDYHLKIREPWPKGDREQLEVIQRTEEIGDDAAVSNGPGIAGSWLYVMNVTHVSSGRVCRSSPS